MQSNQQMKGMTLLHLLLIVIPVSAIVIFGLKSYADNKIEQQVLANKQQKERMMNDYKISVELISDAYDRWADAMKIANSAPRMSLAEQIKDLQNIRRDVEKINVEPCLNDLKLSLLLTMDSYSDAFISFLGQAPQEKTDAAYKSANELLDDYVHNKIDLIRTCKPDNPSSPSYKDYMAL